MYRHVICAFMYRAEMFNWQYAPPLGLELIARSLQPYAREIEVIDLRFEPGRTADFVRPDTDLVCFAVHAEPDLEFVCGEIRSIPPQVLTVIGGRHATQFPEKWLAECPDLDFVVRGDGEETVEEIARGVPREAIAGVSYRLDGRVVHGPARDVGPMRDDLDPDVVFALKYIRDLTPAKFEEIRRFNWTVSRAGFKRVRECEPKSDAERFWQFVYWRLCSWGGIPRSTGFSTLHAGQTYKLDDLWKFHERLKGVRIVRRDWLETLRECDGKGTLFFIDPPYIEEWGAGGKARGAAVPPEDIAEGVRSLKGSFIIAYTDSARARRALSKVGRIFKMRFLEARHHGLWSKRSRLFVASSDIRKGLEAAGDDDIEWIEADDMAAEASAKAGGSARFVLQYHYFRKRGEKPVRAGPTTWHWDLRIDAGEKTLRHWILDHDVTKAKETVGYFKRDPDKRALDAEGFYPPGSFMNPTKDTPSFVEIVDKGECQLLVDQPALLKVEFRGEELKGAWLLEKKNSNWHVRRTETAPAAKAEEAVACSL